MVRKTHKSGLTFIELLFVLGIGCLLLVIMLPVCSGAKRKSKRTACISNLRHVGMALQLYAQDNDELLPPWRNRRHGPDGNTTKWDSPENIHICVFGKSRDADIMYCPMDVYRGIDRDIFGVNHEYSSYFFNTVPPDAGKGTLTITGLLQGGAVLVPPADYPLVRDSNLGSREIVNGTAAYGCEHRDAVNIIYLDGHAETKQTKNGKIVECP